MVAQAGQGTADGGTHGHYPAIRTVVVAPPTARLKKKSMMLMATIEARMALPPAPPPPAGPPEAGDPEEHGSKRSTTAKTRTFTNDQKTSTGGKNRGKEGADG